jgi:hypothetical protein
MRRNGRSLNRWLRAGAGVLAVAFALAAGGHARAQATPPARFYGSATIDGAPAVAGTVVQAFVGGAVCGTGAVNPGSGYSVDVASATSRSGCGIDGAVVTFTLGGLAADQTGVFTTGVFIPLPLSARTFAPAPLPPHRFYGTVFFNGRPLPAPSYIEVFIGDTRCGTGGVAFGGAYVIDVVSAAVTTGCGIPGAHVRFRVGGALPVHETGVFAIGGFTALDLTIAIPTPPAQVFERPIPGRVTLPPGTSVRFRGSDRSARVISAADERVSVSHDGRSILLTARDGVVILLVETRGADCGQVPGASSVRCFVDRRARITFTTMPVDWW